MMHDREKSDSAIVAGKPTNKAGQPAAESVEPRAEAEGNASRQSTHRTQDRERVSQALEREMAGRKEAAYRRSWRLWRSADTRCNLSRQQSLRESRAPRHGRHQILMPRA